MRHWLTICLGLLLAYSNVDATSPDLRDLQLTDFELVDHRGRNWTLQEFQDDSVLVIAFLGTECPLAKHYALRLEEISQAYADRSVRVVAVISNRQDSLEEIAAFVNRQALTFPVMKDVGNRFADQVAATRTPEIMVFDSNRQLRYQGRVDDQYGVGYVRDQPNRLDLQIALDELLADKSISVPVTRAVGCIIGRSKTVDQDSKITYESHVAKIMADRCVECHRPGEIAPFSLTEYEEVAGWADMIAEVVREGRMPPWHATDDHASFANERSLTDAEQDALFAWAEAGAPSGDLENVPEPPQPAVVGWQLPREPDRVVSVSPQPFAVPATGTVRYQYFVVDPEFETDMWLEAAEFKPGNREVVHHILAFAVPKGQRRGLNAARGFLVGYVPGARLDLAPKGHAKKIPAGSELIFQVHYTPIGTPQEDHSKLGMLFTDPEEVTHEVVTTSAVQPRLRIPPGDANYKTTAFSPTFPEHATLRSFSPHMHVRGKSYLYELETADGQRQALLEIPNYDFNWQTNYVLAEPMQVPRGSRLHCTATFDNSEANLNNPDPTKTVKWGDQTWDEMMIGYYHYSVPISKEVNAKTPAEIARDMIERAVRMNKFKELDTDGDGKLERADTPGKLLPVFDRLDTNEDGVLTREEVSK